MAVAGLAAVAVAVACGTTAAGAGPAATAGGEGPRKREEAAGGACTEAPRSQQERHVDASARLRKAGGRWKV